METAPRPVRRALVTGAGGFLGRHLTERLLRDGAVVHALVRSPEKEHIPAGEGARVFRADLAETCDLREALTGVDTVFHSAGVVGPAGLPYERFYRGNVRALHNLIRACQAVGDVERFVHVSTVAVLGPLKPGDEADEDADPAPDDAYGKTKREAESLALDAFAGGFPVVIARPEWIYGPHSPSTLKLFRHIARGRFVLFGPARNTQQPVWIDDVVDGLIRCATAPGVEGGVYHLVGPRALTVEHLCRTIAAAVGSDRAPLRLPLWPLSILAFAFEKLYSLWGGRAPVDRRKLDFFRVYRAYSFRKAVEQLDWHPRTSFEEGAREMLRWLQETGAL